ncbi:RNA polymerase sigma factor [Microlunatus sp. GCM10028923]|uniref:RNA polymerase sigma factor n=1 Tax=Microlunatus sp. GCM10028923 TaxID=3273400 RepID=UPI0036095762
MTEPPVDHADAELARIVRAEAGLIVAQLHRRLGDFDVAEEAVQLAITDALRAWRRDGPPPNPGGWLSTTARRRAIDLLRRQSRELRRLDGLGADEPWVREPAPEPGRQLDERLPMLFACCHPALAAETRLPLTLRAVVGLTTEQIARAFLTPTATMAQRLVRAKRKITAAGISFALPDQDQLSGRLDDVLSVITVAYNTGYLDAQDQRLAGDMLWLAELVARQLPDQPEAWGLLALLTLQQARSGARLGVDGRLVLLVDQDRERWDRTMIDRADRFLELAAHARAPGRFQLQAAIAACHAAAPSWGDTDWLQIVTLYDLLLRHDPSPVIMLNRAVAVAELAGPAAALAEVDPLAERLAGYYLLHAVRARLLHRVGRHDEGRAADRRALELAANPVEQELLRARLAESG